MNPSARSNSRWKLPYLKNHLAQDNKGFPIIAITETWLNSCITNAQVHIPGYDLIRCDRPLRKGGGVLLYLADDLPFLNVEMLTDKVSQAIACTCETSKTIIINVYRPPDADNSNTKKLIRFLQKYLSDVNENDDYDVMLLGDFNLPNIDWTTTSVESGCSTITNEAASALLDFMGTNFLNQHVTAATRKDNILDLCISNNSSMIQDIDVIDTPLSDHRIIEILLQDHPAYRPVSAAKIFEEHSFRNLKLDKGDWPTINASLKKIDWLQLLSLCQTDEEFPELFRLTFLQICLLYTPKKPAVTGEYKPASTRTCRILTRKKRKLKTRLKAMEGNPHCAATRKKITEELYIMELSIRDKINGDLEDKELEAVKRVKSNPKYFYTYAKQFLTRRSEIKLLMDEEKQPIHDKKGIADLLQRQYTSVFSDPLDPRKAPPSFTAPHCSFPMTDMDLNFDKEDVIKAIDGVKAHAASGPDEIPIRALKECKLNVAEPIYLIWKKSILCGTVPACYKESVITPIHKKDSKVHAKNYRPVSLTSHIIKIFERIIRHKVVDYLERNNLICTSQHGFRSGHSCLSELLDHFDDILTGLLENKDTDIIYLDYAKAFDKVDHPLLIQKLEKYGIHPSLIRWIKDFLTNRSQSVVVNGVHSFIAIIVSGVPQGTVLGPILFIIFINDIGTCIKHSTLRCFADDTRLAGKIDVTSDCDKLQEDLDAVTAWSLKNNMKLHEDKFEYLSHKCRDTFLEELPFTTCHSQYQTASGVTLYPADHIRDLGVTISADLTWDKHISTMLQKANTMSAWVFNVFKSRDPLTMMTLYKSMVRSIVEYCCPLWHPTGSGLTKKIEALQRSFTRRIQTCKDMDYWQRLSFLKLMSLQRRRERYIIITMWKILNNYHPNNMNIQFQEPNRNGIMAKLPPLSKKCRTKHQTLYDSSFAVLGPKLWNNIPAKLTLIQDIDTFKTDLYNDYLHKIPDRPPVSGYSCATSNSVLEWC